MTERKPLLVQGKGIPGPALKGLISCSLVTWRGGRMAEGAEWEVELRCSERELEEALAGEPPEFPARVRPG